MANKENIKPSLLCIDESFDGDDNNNNHDLDFLYDDDEEEETMTSKRRKALKMFYESCNSVEEYDHRFSQKFLELFEQGDFDAIDTNNM